MKLALSLSLCVALVGCIAKKTTGRSLLRAAPATDTRPTCAQVLQDNEYRTLTAQLKPSDPLLVVSTNDLHGRTDEKSVDLIVSQTERHAVTFGGLERLATYLAALCRAAKGRLLYLDAGDSYQGTALSNTSFGQPVVDAFSALGLSASTFGNHEFDFGQDQIKGWLSSDKRSFWYVTSSLNSTAGGQAIPWAQLNAPRFARSVVLDVAGIRVGIAGYTTESTGVKSLPDNVRDIEFQQLGKVLAEESEPLRQQGAQLTVLLSHAGGQCDMSQPPQQGDRACAASGELVRVLQAQPRDARKWSLVVAGHTHAAQRHLIAGTPVVQTTGLGQSLSHAQLTLRGGQVDVQLFDPIYLCDQHFENWSGCHPEEWAWNTRKPTSLGRKVPAQVLGQLVKVQDGSRVQAVLQPHRTRLKEQMAQPITTLNRELPHNRTAHSPAAACLVDAWMSDLKSTDERWGDAAASDIDGAFLNSGALREGLPVGQLTWGRLFEILPFDNTAHVVSLTAEELLRFAQAHEESPHDYLLASDGWVVRRRGNDTPVPRTAAVAAVGAAQKAKRRWNVVVSTFSKSFLSRAGVPHATFDTGLSIRASIAHALERGVAKLPSCQHPNVSRLEF